MLRALPLIFLVLLVSCHRSDVNIQKHQSTIIIDSTVIDELTGLQENFLISSYEFFYLGELHDTITIEREPISDYWNEIQNQPLIRDYTLPDSLKLSIDVDTTTVFSNHRSRFVDERGDSSPVKAYGIFVRNLSNKTIRLGGFNDLAAIQQVQTSDGKWLNVELPQMYFCGTGARVLELRCNDIGIAKFNIGNGKIKVKTRLVMTKYGKSIYSNEFFDHVDSIPTRDLTREMFHQWLDKKEIL